MNASIGLRGQSWRRTWGVGGLLGAMNAQCGCHFAPSAIQRLDSFDLGGAEGFPRLDRWHPLRIVLGRDPLVEFAGVEVAGSDRAAAVVDGLGGRLLIQPQVGLPLGAVGPVALVTPVREDRPDVAVELDVRCRRRCVTRESNDGECERTSNPSQGEPPS